MKPKIFSQVALAIACYWLALIAFARLNYRDQWRFGESNAHIHEWSIHPQNIDFLPQGWLLPFLYALPLVVSVIFHKKKLLLNFNICFYSFSVITHIYVISDIWNMITDQHLESAIIFTEILHVIYLPLVAAILVYLSIFQWAKRLTSDCDHQAGF